MDNEELIYKEEEIPEQYNEFEVDNKGQSTYTMRSIVDFTLFDQSGKVNHIYYNSFLIFNYSNNYILLYYSYLQLRSSQKAI